MDNTKGADLLSPVPPFQGYTPAFTVDTWTHHDFNFLDAVQMKPRCYFLVAWLINHPVPEDKIANEQPLVVAVVVRADYQACPCQVGNLVAP